MVVIPLQSGSNGNCIYVEAEGTAVLLDAGIAGYQAEQRLAAVGRAIRDVSAVVISHDHVDHASHVGVFNRRFGLPVHATPATVSRVAAKMEIGPINDLRFFRAGDTLTIGNLRVETIPTPHDGVDGVAFVVCARSVRLGVLTDLGHVFRGLPEVVASLDGVIIESNYDPQMLVQGPYPPRLQERIRGPGGHLANGECAHLLRSAMSPRLQWACLAHLSENNNHPDIARAVHRSTLGETLPLFVAERYRSTGPLVVEP